MCERERQTDSERSREREKEGEFFFFFFFCYSQQGEKNLSPASGTLVRTPVAEVSVLSRNTQGVRLIRLDEGDQLCGLDMLQSEDDVDEDDDE